MLMTRATRAATIAGLAALVFGASACQARAADLGGNCCQDLEERVAELEATAARKGNRRVTVTVYGQISKAILWHDGFEALGGAGSSRGVVDGSQSPSRFGFMGEAKINPHWKAGYQLEIGVDNNPLGASLEPLSSSLGIFSDLTVRHSFVWVEGPAGKVSLGRTSMATDGIAEISLANTQVASKMLSLEPLSTNVLFGIDLPYDGPRRNVLRYDSPSFGGFMVSAAWSSGGGVGIFSATPGLGDLDTDVWDVALRYAGEFSGFRVAAGIGYRKENFMVPVSAVLLPFAHESVITGSASVMHMTSGIFVSGAAGFAKNVGSFGGAFSSGVDHHAWHLQGGWEKNVTKLGATTIYGEYGQIKIDGIEIDPRFYGLGVVQTFDAAAVDIYLAWRQYDLDLSTDNINTIMAGMRVKF